MSRILKGIQSLHSLKKKLRIEMTIPEQRLWTQLRDKRFFNLKFRRQHGIGPYIVDFYCAEKSLVIEIDGDSHSGEKAFQRDQDRENYLKSLGLKIVRYHNRDILTALDTVMEDVLRRIFHCSTSP